MASHGFVEVADRVWIGRYEWADVNITAIGSGRGLVVIDTHGSAEAGRGVLAKLQRIGGPVAHVVNTHWHWDHSFGNIAFREAAPGVPIHAHEETPVWLAEHGERMKRLLADDQDNPHRSDVIDTEIVLPDQTFATSRTLDLGDRAIELMVPGRGHTSGDVVVRVQDANLLIAGDLIEESSKPWIGMDSWPLEWPGTLDVVLDAMDEGSVAIPGHGATVTRRFVEVQRDEIAQIVRTVRALARAGIPADQAVAEAEWPWEPDERIRNAVVRGYESLAATEESANEQSAG